jgi:hypothetical protein
MKPRSLGYGELKQLHEREYVQLNPILRRLFNGTSGKICLHDY